MRHTLIGRLIGRCQRPHPPVHVLIVCGLLRLLQRLQIDSPLMFGIEGRAVGARVDRECLTAAEHRGSTRLNGSQTLVPREADDSLEIRIYRTRWPGAWDLQQEGERGQGLDEYWTPHPTRHDGTVRLEDGRWDEMQTEHRSAGRRDVRAGHRHRTVTIEA